MLGGRVRQRGQPAHGRAAARRIVEDAREAIAVMLCANLSGQRPDRLIFTSGGTESNNLAVLGMCGEMPRRLIISAIEHPSVVGPAEYLATQGGRSSALGSMATGSRGRWTYEHSRFRVPGRRIGPVRLSPPSCWAITKRACCNRSRKSAAICRDAGVRLHTDAVQVVGKLPVSFERLGAATLAFSAHKFHGPRGIGGLLVHGDVELSPLFYGGFQQGGLRPGTEPVALIAGMHKALEIWRRDYEEHDRRMTAAVRDRFEAARSIAIARCGHQRRGAPRLPHTSNVSFRGLDRRALAMALIWRESPVRRARHASGSSEPSPVLLAMGLPPDVVAGSLRFSLGATTSEAEIDVAVERIVAVCQRLRWAVTTARREPCSPNYDGSRTSD